MVPDETLVHAARYLASHGYRIKERNFRTPTGEVDIIAEKGEVLAFIEVKARTSDTFGPPHLAVHRRKQRQIVRAAQWYLAEQRTPNPPCRFDVLAVTFPEDGGTPRIDWVRDAFPAEGVEVW
jgi:putative endonuclease